MARQVLERAEERVEERLAEVERKVSPYQRVAGIVGAAAFAGAFVMSIVSGFVAANNAGVTLTLVMLGLIVSALNISAREVTPILVASIGLIVGATANVFTPLNTLVVGLGTSINSVVAYFATFMIPVAVITAIRAVLRLARPGERLI
ncbi:MAG: hypothetical protein HY671_09410 [Chloroflexi bacterium]|nr:hypothetical protein [Chloroflexota bacterium]